MSASDNDVNLGLGSSVTTSTSAALGDQFVTLDQNGTISNQDVGGQLMTFATADAPINSVYVAGPNSGQTYNAASLGVDAVLDTTGGDTLTTGGAQGVTLVGAYGDTLKGNSDNGTLVVDGAGVKADSTDDVVDAAASSSFTVQGGGNSVNAAAGDNFLLTATGSNADTVTASNLDGTDGSDINLGINALANLIGDNDAATLSGGASLDLSGTQFSLSGTNGSFSLGTTGAFVTDYGRNMNVSADAGVSGCGVAFGSGATVLNDAAQGLTFYNGTGEANASVALQSSSLAFTDDAGGGLKVSDGAGITGGTLSYAASDITATDNAAGLTVRDMSGVSDDTLKLQTSDLSFINNAPDLTLMGAADVDGAGVILDTAGRNLVDDIADASFFNDTGEANGSVVVGRNGLNIYDVAGGGLDVSNAAGVSNITVTLDYQNLGGLTDDLTGGLTLQEGSGFTGGAVTLGQNALNITDNATSIDVLANAGVNNGGITFGSGSDGQLSDAAQGLTFYNAAGEFNAVVTVASGGLTLTDDAGGGFTALDGSGVNGGTLKIEADNAISDLTSGTVDFLGSGLGATVNGNFTSISDGANTGEFINIGGRGDTGALTSDTVVLDNTSLGFTLNGAYDTAQDASGILGGVVTINGVGNTASIDSGTVIFGTSNIGINIDGDDDAVHGGGYTGDIARISGLDETGAFSSDTVIFGTGSAGIMLTGGYDTAQDAAGMSGGTVSFDGVSDTALTNGGTVIFGAAGIGINLDGSSDFVSAAYASDVARVSGTDDLLGLNSGTVNFEASGLSDEVYGSYNQIADGAFSGEALTVVGLGDNASISNEQVMLGGPTTQLFVTGASNTVGDAADTTGGMVEFTGAGDVAALVYGTVDFGAAGQHIAVTGYGDTVNGGSFTGDTAVLSGVGDAVYVNSGTVDLGVAGLGYEAIGGSNNIVSGSSGDVSLIGSADIADISNSTINFGTDYAVNTISGSGNILTGNFGSGVGDTAVISGNYDTAQISNGTLDLGKSNLDTTLDATGDVLNGGAYSSEVVNDVMTGNALNLNGATIIFGMSGINATLDGGSNTVNGGYSTDGLTIAGAGNLVDLSSGGITALANTTALTINGDNDFISTTSGDSSVVNGSGENIVAQGGQSLNIASTSGTFDAVTTYGVASGGFADDGQATGVFVGADSDVNFYGSGSYINLTSGDAISEVGGGDSIQAGAGESVYIANAGYSADTVYADGLMNGGFTADQQATQIYLGTGAKTVLDGNNDFLEANTATLVTDQGSHDDIENVGIYSDLDIYGQYDNIGANGAYIAFYGNHSGDVVNGSGNASDFYGDDGDGDDDGDDDDDGDGVGDGEDIAFSSQREAVIRRELREANSGGGPATLGVSVATLRGEGLYGKGLPVPKQPPATARWKGGAITYSLSGAKALTAQDRAVIAKALEAWSAASGLVFEQVTGSQRADIRINAGDLQSATTGVLGKGVEGSSSGRDAASAIITLEAGLKSGLTQGSDGQLTYAGAQVDLYQLALYEVGHALGLNDENDPGSVMYHGLGSSNRQLDASDIAAVDALYGPLQSVGGGNTLEFNAGYGLLVINQVRPVGDADNVLEFAAGISSDQVSVSADATGNVTLTLPGADQVVLASELNSDGANIYGVQSVQFADGTSWSYAQLLAKADTPSASNTSLYGDALANVFDSQGIATYEQGNGGGDTFVYNQGYGPLTIYEADTAAAPANTLAFGAGITPGSVQVTGDAAGDLVLALSGSDQVTLTGALGGGGGTTYGVQAVTFADGSSWTYQDLLQLADTPSPSNTSLYGDTSANLLDSQGVATYEQGNGGGDTFVDNAGYGALTIDEVDTSASPDNTLAFGAGVTAASISVTANARGDLILNLPGTDSVTLVDALNSGDGATYGVQAVTFADGSSWSYSDLLAMADTPSSTNTSLYGDAAANRLDSQGIATYEQGNGGGDTYVFDAGYGSLTIDNANVEDAGASGRISLGAGIDPDQVWFSQSGNDLLINIAGTTDQIDVENWFGVDPTAQVASIQTSDGEVITASQVGQLVQSMASFSSQYASSKGGASSALPATGVNDPGLLSAIASTWHVRH